VQLTSPWKINVFHLATRPAGLPFSVIPEKKKRKKYFLTLWRLGGFGDFRKKTAVFGCLTNTLAPPLIVLESCSTAQTDWPV